MSASRIWPLPCPPQRWQVSESWFSRLSQHWILKSSLPSISRLCPPPAPCLTVASIFNALRKWVSLTMYLQVEGPYQEGVILSAKFQFLNSTQGCNFSNFVQDLKPSHSIRTPHSSLHQIDLPAPLVPARNMTLCFPQVLLYCVCNNERVWAHRYVPCTFFLLLLMRCINPHSSITARATCRSVTRKVCVSAD